MKPGTIDIPVRLTIEDAEVRRIHLDPGDVLVVNVPAKISAAQAERIRDKAKNVFPNNRVIVMSDGTTLEVATADPLDNGPT